MKFAEVRFRDCPWCGLKFAALEQVWSSISVSGASGKRSWAAYSCPSCAGVILVELILNSTQKPNNFTPNTEVVEIQSIPEAADSRYKIKHLPEDVEGYLSDALKVLQAGVPDAAAVQLRRTIEAASLHHNIDDRVLVQRIKKMMEEGLITRDFEPAIHHIRLIGNIGAHASDDRLDQNQVERALNFTVQLLRNLFEVPGELKELQESDNGDN